MTKVRVKTFRGFSEYESIREATRAAKDMILDIITDGQPSHLWWARIDWIEQKKMRIWSCPKVGVWQFSPWYDLELSLFDD